MKVFAKENIEMNSLLSFVFFEHPVQVILKNINACILFARVDEYRIPMVLSIRRRDIKREAKRRKS